MLVIASVCLQKHLYRLLTRAAPTETRQSGSVKSANEIAIKGYFRVAGMWLRTQAKPANAITMQTASTCQYVPPPA